jgi:hypothetical protein
MQKAFILSLALLVSSMALANPTPVRCCSKNRQKGFDTGVIFHALNPVLL